jgi:hypothetical protein
VSILTGLNSSEDKVPNLELADTYLELVVLS